MTPFTSRRMKEAILTVLARISTKVHKINLIGCEFQLGPLEAQWASVDDVERRCYLRSLAARAGSQERR